MSAAQTDPNEKKWFLHIDGKNDGPLSISEMRDRNRAGVLTSTTFVWCDGMADWVEAAQVSALAEVFSAGAASSFDAGTGRTRMAGAEGTIAAGPQVKQGSSELTMTGAEALPLKTQANIRAGAHAAAAGASAGGKSSKTRYVILGGVGLTVIGLAVAGSMGFLSPVFSHPAVKSVTGSLRDALSPVTLKLVDRFPGLASLFPPLPALDDVAPEDLADLESAAVGLPADVGPKMALVLSLNEGAGPFFYGSTNLPDGAKAELLVEGMPDTLVRQLSGFVKVQGVFEKRLMKTPPVKASDGQALPKGEYVVSLYEADQQPEAVATLLAPMPAKTVAKASADLPKGRKLVIRRVFFLGGKKDEAYKKQLAEVHETLKQKAKSELEEVKQLSATLESQLKETTDQFKRLRGMKNSKAAQKAWGEFHGKWSGLDAKLTEAFQKWTPEILTTQLFYGVLYSQVLATGQAVQKAHGMHQSFFTGGAADPKAFEIQQGEALSAAESALNGLKAKVDAAEKIPPSPAGLPRREGL